MFVCVCVFGVCVAVGLRNCVFVSYFVYVDVRVLLYVCVFVCVCLCLYV